MNNEERKSSAYVPLKYFDEPDLVECDDDTECLKETFECLKTELHE